MGEQTALELKPRVNSVPVLVAGNGPRSVRFAAHHGDGWITTGPMRSAGLDAWLDGLDTSRTMLDEALAEAGRDVDAYPRYVNLDSSPAYSLSSPETFADLVRRVGDLGFTDVISHWPRASDPYAGDEGTLETVATQVIPGLRA